MQYFLQTTDENGEKQWITKSILALIGILTTVFSSGVVVVYCLVRVMKETSAAKYDSFFKKIRKRLSSFHLQPKTKQMQRQLFRALLWQV